MADLLDSDSIWRSDPLEAFRAFVQTEEFVKLGRRKRVVDGAPLRHVKASSAAIYIHMFDRFTRWLAVTGRDLYELTADDLTTFLELTDTIDDEPVKILQSAIRVRYLRLFERVFAHLHIDPNPARHASFAIYQAQQAGRDAPKEVLTQQQQIAFLRSLPTVAPFDPANPTHPSWKRRRDRAMLCMMIGAGLKVSEVIGLYVDNVKRIDSTGSIPIEVSPASTAGTSRWHHTQLRPFATHEVLAWLEERKCMNLQSRLLFPASLNGDARLNKATVYRQVKKVMEAGGIDVQRQGGRTLRNTYAVRELETNSIELVGEFMGHRLRRSTEAYVHARPKKKLL